MARQVVCKPLCKPLQNGVLVVLAASVWTPRWLMPTDRLLGHTQPEC
jgi:hypothetical protein